MTAYRREAEAQKAVEVDETTRRVAEARLTQIEREIRSAMVASDIDNRIRIALENERAVLEEAVGQAIARFVKMKIRLLEAKLKKLER